MADDPRDQAQFDARFSYNTYATGTGAETRQHLPCPFCAARDWQSILLLEFEHKIQTEATCSNCGRSGRAIVTSDESASKVIEFVQTGGPDAPDWMVPPPRRVDEERAEDDTPPE
jgi:hypothetical protein